MGVTQRQQSESNRSAIRIMIPEVGGDIGTGVTEYIVILELI